MFDPKEEGKGAGAVEFCTLVVFSYIFLNFHLFIYYFGGRGRPNELAEC